MCRILSYAGKINTVDAQALLSGFQKLAACGNIPKGMARGHRDGWGIVGYRKKKVSFFEKYPCDAFIDPRYAETSERIVQKKPEIVVAHIRKSSVGKNETNNTHPFVFRGLVFCHNGTIFNKERIPLQKRFRAAAKGRTDSELFFLCIVQLYNASLQKTSAAMTQAISQAVVFARENLNYTALNMSLSDGRSLWALREINTHNATVKEKRLVGYYTLYIGEGKNNIAVCSEKIALKNRRWRALRNHELVRYDIKTRKSEVSSI